MKTIERDTAAQVLKGFALPPRPDVLARFNEEKNKPNPSLKKIAAIVSVDPGISASLIKTINSPLFGSRRKIASVDEAVGMLGLSSLDNIVTSLALMTASGKPVGMDRFWDTAMDVAGISRSLARNVAGVSENDAYMLGMFHDCGIALLMQRIPDYKAFLIEANQQTAKTLPEMEEARYQTNHTSVGFLVAKAWNLPEHICEAIAMHHERIDFRHGLTGKDERILPMLAVLKMANYLSHVNRRIQDANDWLRERNPVLHYLGISEDEFEEIENEMRDNSRVTPQQWIARTVS